MVLSLMLFFCTMGLITFLTMVIGFLGEFSNTSREESSTYECGFEHHSFSRIPFSIRYFMLTLVFLIFDMEVMFLMFLPNYYLSGLVSSLMLFGVLAFVVVLILGLLYEWLDGSLEWVM